MNLGNFQHRAQRLGSQRGYMLLVLVLFVSLLALATMAAAPKVVQQIQRDREIEMIHRGAQYARAIRKYVKKNGTYPTSLEQLEDSNHVRYLRRRYKDPYSADGKWRALHVGDVPFMGAGQGVQSNGQQSGQQSGQLGQPGGIQGQSGGIQGQSGGMTGMGQPLGQLAQSPGGLGQPLGSPGGLMAGNQGTQGLGGSSTFSLGLGSQQTPSQPGGLGSGSGSSASLGGLSSQPSNQQALSFGGGAIVGVASSSERQGIKEFNRKNKYKEWYFVYDPAAEATNPNGGALIIGPYTGRTYGGTASGGIGTPAGQLASPNQPSGFGQPIGSGFSGTSPSGSSPTTSTPAGSSPKPAR